MMTSSEGLLGGPSASRHSVGEPSPSRHGLVAAAWPDGTERRVFCCAEGSGRKERVIDVPFFPYLGRKERVGIFFTRKAADRRSGAFVARR